MMEWDAHNKYRLIIKTLPHRDYNLDVKQKLLLIRVLRTY